MIRAKKARGPRPIPTDIGPNRRSSFISRAPRCSPSPHKSSTSHLSSIIFLLSPPIEDSPEHKSLSAKQTKKQKKKKTKNKSIDKRVRWWWFRTAVFAIGGKRARARVVAERAVGGGDGGRRAGGTPPVDLPRLPGDQHPPPANHPRSNPRSTPAKPATPPRSAPLAPPASPSAHTRHPRRPRRCRQSRDALHAGWISPRSCRRSSSLPRRRCASRVLPKIAREPSPPSSYSSSPPPARARLSASRGREYRHLGSLPAAILPLVRLAAQPRTTPNK